MTHYAIATDLNRCVGLPGMQRGVQGHEQRAGGRLLEQDVAHRPESEEGWLRNVA